MKIRLNNTNQPNYRRGGMITPERFLPKKPPSPKANPFLPQSPKEKFLPGVPKDPVNIQDLGDGHELVTPTDGRIGGYVRERKEKSGEGLGMLQRYMQSNRWDDQAPGGLLNLRQ